jgi:tryptophan synthase alpha subunit
MQTGWSDGLIVVDLPWPENKNFSKKCKKILLILYNFYLQQLLEQE